MAGSRKGTSGSGAGTGPSRASAAKGRGAERSPSEHAHEALSEWGRALRYAGAALRPKIGERAGQAADTLMSRLGSPGALASKLGAGSRIGEWIGGDGRARSDGGGALNGGGFLGHAKPVPNP